MRRLRIGEVQASALSIYVFDVAHGPTEGMELQRNERTGTAYFAYEPGWWKIVWSVLIEASNSADADAERLHGDGRRYAREDAAALAALALRVQAP